MEQNDYITLPCSGVCNDGGKITTSYITPTFLGPGMGQSGKITPAFLGVPQQWGQDQK